jgi:hypothetical protein
MWGKLSASCIGHFTPWERDLGTDSIVGWLGLELRLLGLRDLNLVTV